MNTSSFPPFLTWPFFLPPPADLSPLGSPLKKEKGFAECEKNNKNENNYPFLILVTFAKQKVSVKKAKTTRARTTKSPMEPRTTRTTVYGCIPAVERSEPEYDSTTCQELDSNGRQVLCLTQKEQVGWLGKLTRVMGGRGESSPLILQAIADFLGGTFGQNLGH